MKWFVYDIWYLTPTARGAIAKPDEDFVTARTPLAQLVFPYVFRLILSWLKWNT